MDQTNQTIQSCKVDYCPACQRKLCKRIEIEGSVYIEVKHRGTAVLGLELVVMCVGCRRLFSVTAKGGLMGEVNFGR